ncbi:MAG: DUF2264 domain-containing protein, partial [Limisphaerales bacterium]
MESRRKFLKSVTAFGVAGVVGMSAENSAAQTFAAASGKTDDRSYWLAVMEKIAAPVLENLARRKLKVMMPVEAANPADRAKYTHLEAFGRLLAGKAPWLPAQGLALSEAVPQKKF